MSIYDDWKQMTQMAQTPEQQSAFWNEYFAMETKNYEKILGNSEKIFEGTFSSLAAEFEMEETVFAGFMDGINSSLKTEVDVENIASDTSIKLDIDMEKLFFNMLDAKANWLYELKEWDDILTAEKRNNIKKEWRASKQAVADKTVGRNDPCPCGGGLKFKKCCGK